MKLVFSNSECIHIFAQRSQNEGKNSNRSIFFTNSELYSYGYHFCLAKFVENENGQLAVLINNSSYSNSTAKHQNLTRSATSHYKQIFCPNPTDRFKCIRDWKYRANEILNKLTTARKPEIYLNQISYLKAEISAYFEFFGENIPFDLDQLLNVSNKEEYKEYRKNEAEILAAAEKKRIEDQKKKFAADLKKWLNFEIRSIQRFELDYLRLNKDQNRIETTQNVFIPLLAAEKLYLSIKNKTLNVGDTILNYSVRSIDKNFINIGCHKFEVKELLKFGKKQFSSK